VSSNIYILFSSFLSFMKSLKMFLVLTFLAALFAVPALGAPVVSEVYPSTAEAGFQTEFKANASDANQVANCTFYWAGNPLAQMTLISGDNTSGTWAYNYTPSSTGPFQAYANCTNALGESAYNDTTITVQDTTPPTVGQVSPDQLEKKNYTETTGDVGGLSTSFRVSASDNSGSVSCHFYWDGQDMGEMSSSGKKGLGFGPTTEQLNQMVQTEGIHHAWANCSDPSGNWAYNDTIVRVFTPVHVTLSQRDCVVDGQATEYQSGDDYSSKASTGGVTYQLDGTNYAATDSQGRYCLYYAAESGAGDRYIYLGSKDYAVRLSSNASSDTAGVYTFNSSSAGWDQMTANGTYAGYYIEFSVLGDGVEIRINSSDYYLISNYTTVMLAVFGGGGISFKWPKYYVYSSQPTPPNISSKGTAFADNVTIGARFDTNVSTSCTVYARAGSEEKSAGEGNKFLSHVVGVSGLSPGKEYNITIKCCYPNSYYCTLAGPFVYRTADESVTGTGMLLSKNFSGAFLNVSFSSSGSMRISRFNTCPVPNTPPGTPVYYFDVYSDASGQANITIYYNESDLTTAGVSEDNLAVYHWTGSAWEQVSASVDQTSNSVSFSLSSLSPITLGSGSGSSGGSTAATVVSAPGMSDVLIYVLFTLGLIYVIVPWKRLPKVI